MMRRSSSIAMLLAALVGCSGKQEQGSTPSPPQPSRPVAVTDAAPTTASDAGAAAKAPAETPNIHVNVKSVTTPDKIQHKDFSGTRTWKPKKGFKFVAVEAEVQFDKCEGPPLKAPKGARTGALDMEIESCSAAIHGCISNLVPMKLKKGETKPAEPEKTAGWQTTKAFLIKGDQKVTAMGAKWEGDACGGCEVTVTARCPVAQRPNSYVLYFSVDSAFDPKAATFELQGVRQSLSTAP